MTIYVSLQVGDREHYDSSAASFLRRFELPGDIPLVDRAKLVTRLAHAVSSLLSSAGATPTTEDPI